MQPNYSFTTMQCIHTIANWKLQPFTLPELNYLLKFFAPDKDNASYEYGQNDIESFILETLSDMELPAADTLFIQDLHNFITTHPYFISTQVVSRCYNPVFNLAEGSF